MSTNFPSFKLDSPTQANPENGLDTPTSLVIVGLGIQWASQTTLAAQHAIRGADKVLFAVADPWAASWVHALNPSAESLPYDGVTRARIYEVMADRILAEVERGVRVCAVFYGSPAVLARPAHVALRRARAAGIKARMLPGVSSIECLFTDLAIDPGECGCQIYEANDFVKRPRVVDASAHLILCQVAMIANRSVFDGDRERIERGLQSLSERLLKSYPPTHPVTVYEAATHPLVQPVIVQLALSELRHAEVSEVASLYVPPLGVDSSALSAPFETSATDEQPTFGATSMSLKKLIDPKPPNKTRLIDFDRAVREAKSPEELRPAIRRRGNFKINHGLARAGLVDLLNANAPEPRRDKGPSDDETVLQRFRAENSVAPDPESLAQLGEGFRVFARDELLSRDGGLNDVFRAVDSALACFREALKKLKSPAQPTQRLSAYGWTQAHLAATYCMVYWMRLSAGQDDLELFKLADAGFITAIESFPAYSWARQFRAFLYALRAQRGGPGEKSDFDIAIELLNEIKDDDRLLQSSLCRSRAMLFSYDAIPDPQDVRASGSQELTEKEAANVDLRAAEAAYRSINESFQGVNLDSEDFTAGYFGTVSQWALSRNNSEAERAEEHRVNLKAAIAASRVRSSNALSQALASLAGLALIELMDAYDSSKEPDARPPEFKQVIDRATRVLGQLQDCPADLETRAMFIRDPVFREARRRLPGAGCDEIVDLLRSIEQKFRVDSPKFQLS